MKGETFDPAVSLHGSGAGLLEEPGAADRYCFTLPEDSSLLIDSADLPSDGRWRLWSPRAAFPAREGTSGAATTVKGLSGAGCIEIRSDSTSFEALTYGLNLVVVPDPQVFETELVAGAVKITDGKVNGVVTAGAGQLETQASQDVYHFTIPDNNSTIYELNLDATAAQWSLTSSGEPLGRTMRGSDQWEGPLHPGHYEFAIRSFDGHAGAYDLQITSFAPKLSLSADSVVSSNETVKATASWNRDLSNTRYVAYLVDANGTAVASAGSGRTLTADIDVDDVRELQQREYFLWIQDNYAGVVVDTTPVASLQVKAMSFMPGLALSATSVVSSNETVKATASWNRDLSNTRYVAYLVDANGAAVASSGSGTTLTADIDVDDVRELQLREYSLQILDYYTGSVVDTSSVAPLEVKAMSFAPKVTLASSSVVSSNKTVKATASWNRDLSNTRYMAYLVDANGTAVASAWTGTTLTANIDVDNVSALQLREYSLQILDYYTGSVLDTSPVTPLEVKAMSFAPKVTLASSSVVSSNKTVKATASWNRDLKNTRYGAYLVDANGSVVASAATGTTLTANLDVDNVSALQLREYSLRIYDVYVGIVVDTSPVAPLEVKAMSFAPKVTLASSSVVSSNKTVKATASWNRDLKNTRYGAYLVDANGSVVASAATGTTLTANLDVDNVTAVQQRQYSLQIYDVYAGIVVDTSPVAPLQVKAK